MGHQVVLIVGDWTAQIGDPSGQSIMRPMLTAEEVRANAETYMRQFFHVVDREKTEVRWQSEWFTDFSLADVVRLTARFTVAQMLQREDFRTRFQAHQPLGVHELLYPMLQAYDSVVIQADVEFGGSDQLFNLLVGRELQEAMGQRPQSCFVMKLLVGTDGQQKMSKSLGNTIDFEDPPGEKYGKVMSIPDSALLEYLELATDIPDEELAFLANQIESGSGAERMAIKKRLAREIVSQFDGQAAAEDAEGEWVRVFSEGETPTGIEIQVAWDSLPFADVIAFQGHLVSPNEHLEREGNAPIKLASFIAMAMSVSVTEARRLLDQGAVEIDGAQVKERLPYVRPGSVVRIGKHHFFRIVDSDSQKTS
jgi:tyrosyl-tRNA synthetase